MKRIILALCVLALFGCKESIESQTTKMVQAQQEQYSIAQPLPVFDWSLERDLLIQLYNLRNMMAATHSVWRSDYGMIEGDCPSIGFGIPYDTSLTNPLMATDENQDGGNEPALVAIEQAEPNGIFASKNTNATWIMCVGEFGNIEPIYTEAKVTGYPYPVTVDYDRNRVTRSGKANITIARPDPAIIQAQIEAARAEKARRREAEGIPPEPERPE